MVLLRCFLCHLPVQGIAARPECTQAYRISGEQFECFYRCCIGSVQSRIVAEEQNEIRSSRQEIELLQLSAPELWSADSLLPQPTRLKAASASTVWSDPRLAASDQLDVSTETDDLPTIWSADGTIQLIRYGAARVNATAK